MLGNIFKSLKRFYCLISANLSFLIVLLTASISLAHNVTIFAWVEGDTVYTESKFNGGRRAKNAAIEVYDAAGAKLLSGKTDQNGEFSFKLPKKEELKIVLLAGMGHGNQWILTTEDIAEAQAEPSASPIDLNSKARLETTPMQSSAPVKKPKEDLRPSDSELHTAFEAMLDKKLAPIFKKLSYLETKQKEDHGITEIVGGIGYILGLMGLAAFIHYRRKTKDLPSESRLK